MKNTLALALILITINLQAQELKTELLIQTGHSLPAQAVWSPNGKYILSYSKDGSLKLWDTEGNVIKKYTGHGNDVYSAAFFPDGKNFATTGADGTIKIWNLETGLIRSIPDKVFPNFWNAVHINADGKTLMTQKGNGYNEKVFTWDINGKSTGKKDAYEFNKFKQKEVKLNELGFKLFENTEIRALAVSPDGKYIATATDNLKIVLWTWEGNFVRAFDTGFTAYVNNLGFSPDGKRLLASAFQLKEYKEFSLTGELLQTIAGYHEWCYGIGYLPNGNIYTMSSDGTAAIWDSQGKQLKKEKVIADWGGTSSALSGNGKVLAAAKASIERGQQFINFIDAETLKAKTIGYLNNERVTTLALNSSGSLAASAVFENNKISLWTENGLLRQIEAKTNAFYGTALCFSPDDQYLAAGYYDYTVSLFKTDGTFVKNFLAHTSQITALAFSPNGKYLVSTSVDSETIIWHIESGKHVSLVTKNDEWLMFTSEGLFDGSRNGGRLAAIVQGLEVYGLDQFAVKNNRPDLILKSLQIENQALIDHYYERYLLRLKKLGFTEEQLSGELHVPTANISSKTQTDKFIELTVEVADTKYALKSYQVFVNNVPLFGSEGKPLSGNTSTLKEKIELIEGDNKIEISCMNEKGAESLRALIRTKYEKPAKGNLYYLAFGVSTYKDPSLNLKYAAKDATDLNAVFQKMKGGIYGEVYSKVFVNEQVTAETIKSAKAFLANAKPDDIFILFIAGHGMYDRNKSGTYYYLTHNANVNSLETTAANFDVIEDLLQGIAPRRKVFFMDTCESGEQEESTENGYLAQANTRGIQSRGFKPVKGAKTTQTGNRTYLFQKDRFIYNDMARRSGAIVFSSSKGGEFSYESDEIQNGFFTQELMNALTSKLADANNDSEISTDELRDFLRTEVARKTNGLQNPTVDRDNIYQKIGFGVK